MNKKITKIWLLLLLITPFTIIKSQVSDLSLLGGLAEEMAKQEATQQRLPDEEKDRAEEKDVTKPKKKISFEDNNFGFTGGKNFNSNPQTRFSKQPLKYFGYDFFADAPSTFAPVINVPVPEDYILGPGDNIKVLLFGNKGGSMTLKVTREGDVLFPEIGPINIAGLTFSEMKSTIETIVRNTNIGTEVNVTLGKLRSINIFILGDSFQPGMYTVSALSTLTNAIFASGGINVSGSLRDIQLKRNGKLISSFDFYDLLLKGDTSNDKRLMSGDVIFIPPITKTVGINGEVFRPGIYELKEEETLYDLIKYAANQKPKADKSSAQIERIDSVANVFKLIDINLGETDSANINLERGDLIKIFPVQDNLNDAILLSGHAQQPGFYPWYQGMRITDLINSNNLLVMTDLNYVLIKRENKLTKKYVIYQTDLEKVFMDPSSSSNIILEERDEVILLPRLLNIHQVTTTFIQDEVSFEEETEWKSLRYLKKSISENQKDSKSILASDEKDENFQSNAEDLQDTQNQKNIEQKYYEYTIYDYCVLSTKQAKELTLIEEGLTDLLDETDLLDITQLCRNQIIEPILEILRAQHNLDNSVKTISVFGNVRFPGFFPYANNMNVEQAINAAGGTKGGTYEPEIEILRKELFDKDYITSKLVTSANDSRASNLVLSPMDIITVKEIKGETESVKIEGEVYFTGEFPIQENETLGDLIKRAGGLTEYASPTAAVFTRVSLGEEQILRLESAKRELTRRILYSSQEASVGQGEDSTEQITQLLDLLTEDTIEPENLGRLIIDLGGILDGSIADIVLESGDTLVIPKIRQTVSVIGEVYVPTTHIFKGGNTISDYISLSGGENQFADLDNIYLIKANGSIISSEQLSSGSSFFRAGRNTLGSGDTIVVPLRIRSFDGLQATTEITQIIYQMALAAAAVNSF